MVFTVTPVEGQSVDLAGIKLFAAEYRDDVVLTNIQFGINAEIENGIEITVDIPQSENYKLFLWDKNIQPITEIFRK